MSCWKTRDLTIALCVFKYTRKLLDISSAIILPLILYGRNHDLANAWHGSLWLHHMDGYISGMLATGNVYLTVVYMWNNNHKPVSWYLISQRSTCPNPLLFVTFSLQLDSDGNGSDQDISEYSYGLFAYLKCRPDNVSLWTKHTGGLALAWRFSCCLVCRLWTTNPPLVLQVDAVGFKYLDLRQPTIRNDDAAHPSAM